MAKTKADDRKGDGVRKKPKDKKSKPSGSVKRRRPVKWDTKKDNMLVLAALNQKDMPPPNFKELADALGSELFSPDQCRKRLRYLNTLATEILEDRAETAAELLAIQEGETAAEEESEAESVSSREPPMEPPLTPISCPPPRPATRPSSRGYQINTYPGRSYRPQSDRRDTSAASPRDDTRELSIPSGDSPRSTTSSDTYGTPSSVGIFQAVQIPTRPRTHDNRGSGSRNTGTRSHTNNDNRNRRAERPQIPPTRPLQPRGHDQHARRDPNPPRPRDSYRPSRLNGPRGSRLQINNGLVHQHFG